MKLIYINEIGLDYKGQKIYEFIFGDMEDILQDDWYEIPSSGNALPPDISSIESILTVKDSDFMLTLIQMSDSFGMVDAVDGVISLGWEDFDVNRENRSKRIHFKYGETIEEVSEKLKERQINFKIEKLKHE